MHDAVIIIQARMESSRLPGKVLKELAGKPLIVHLIERLKKIPCHDVVVAVSEARESLPLTKYLTENNLRFFTGHSTDLYSRFLKIVNLYKSKAIVRVTADNPLTDTDAIEGGIIKLIDENLDYLWMDNCPKGCGCDIFARSTFLRLQYEEFTDYEREHIVPIFRNRPELKGSPITCKFPQNADKLSLTVDTESDYENMKTIFEKYYSESSGIDVSQVVRNLLSK